MSLGLIVSLLVAALATAGIVKGASKDKDISESFVDLGKKLTGSGLTTADKEKIQLEDDYLDENREQEYQMLLRKWNDMDSPLAQMKSNVQAYEYVGLNKMGLAGSGALTGASGSTSGASSGSADSSNGDPSAVVSALLGAIGLQGDLKLKSAETKLKNEQATHQSIVNKWEDRMREAEYNERIANTLNLVQGTAKLLQETKYAEQLALYAPQLLESKVQEQFSSAEKDRASAALSNAQVKLTDKQIENLDEVIKNHKKERDVMDAKISEIHQNMIALASRAYRDDAEASNLYKQNEKLDAEIKAIGNQIGLSELDIKYYIWNHARTNRVFGIQWNNSSQNGVNSAVPDGLTDLQLMSALRSRGLISEDDYTKWYLSNDSTPN